MVSRSSTITAPFVLALVAGPVCIAQGPYTQPPLARPAVLITTGHTAGSPWRLELVSQDNLVRVTHDAHPGLVFEIDADGPEDDQRYEGVTLRAGNLSFEGRMYGSTVSLFSPDHDAGRTERVLVEALDQRLRVRFEGGSYRKLSPAGPDLPVYFESVFSIDNDRRLNASLNGLYYLFPSSGGSKVAIRTHAGPVSRDFPAGKTGYEYFEHVTEVEVNDAKYGVFRLEGLVERLQVHAHGANADVFELDMDHSFKDRGQKEVSLRFVLTRPLPAASEVLR